MKRAASFAMVVVGALGGFWAAGLLNRPAAAEPEKKPTVPAADAKAKADDAAMMEAWAKVSNPAAEHKALEVFAGEWTAKATFWYVPGAPPEESTGAMKSTWVLGGRWLRQEWTGQMMGQPFSGIGYWGYDLISKNYSGHWMDTMGTAAMPSTGSYDAKTNTWTMHGAFKDPLGQAWKQRQVISVADKDHHTLDL